MTTDLERLTTEQKGWCVWVKIIRVKVAFSQDTIPSISLFHMVTYIRRYYSSKGLSLSQQAFIPFHSFSKKSILRLFGLPFQRLRGARTSRQLATIYHLKSTDQKHNIISYELPTNSHQGAGARRYLRSGKIRNVGVEIQTFL